MSEFDPIEAFANLRHEFGEHGGVNMSIETSTTFTVLSADTSNTAASGGLRVRMVQKLTPLAAKANA